MEEKFQHLKSFLEVNDLSLKGDFNEIVKSAKYVTTDKENFKKYYKWQGYAINNRNNLSKIVEIENEKIGNFVSLYEKYKDYDVITKNSQANLDSKYKFTPLNVLDNGTVTNDGFLFNVSNLKVSPTDLSLFVEGTNYKLVIGAIEVGGNSSHILPIAYSEEEVVYSGNNFEITANTSFEIPILTTGQYVLAYYIATSNEGIRVSNPYTLVANVVKKSTKYYENIVSDLFIDGEEIVVNCYESSTINISLSGQYTYESLYAELEHCAYVYGMTTQATLEVEEGSNWVSVDSTNIVSGKYRLKYLANEKVDYVVVTLITK